MNDNPLPPLVDSVTEVAAIGYLLRALGAYHDYAFVTVEGLPTSSIFVDETNVLIVTTTAPAPVYRAAIRKAAIARRADLILIRTPRLAVDTLTVSVDVAAAALPCQPWIEHDLSIGIYDGRTWLVPDHSGPCFSVTSEGLNFEMIAPFDTALEKCAGLRHAGHILAQLVIPIGVR